MARMKGHKVRCRCVGCSPQTRKKGLRAAKRNPSKQVRRILASTGRSWYRHLTVDGQLGRMFTGKAAAIRWAKRHGGEVYREHAASTGRGTELVYPVTRSNPRARRVPVPCEVCGRPDNTHKCRSAECYEYANRAEMQPQCYVCGGFNSPLYRTGDYHVHAECSDTKQNPGRRRPPLSMVAKPQPLVQLGTGEVICSACGDHAVYRWADPCMDAVKARHRAAVTGRCTCPKRKQRGRTVSNGHRIWIACDRCLGTIKQLNPGARDLPQPVSPRTKHYLETRGSVPGRKIGEYELKENPAPQSKRRFKRGDHVAFAREFLQSTGMLTGEVPFMRGIVDSVQSDADWQTAVVKWDNGEATRVNSFNLVLVDDLQFEGR